MSPRVVEQLDPQPFRDWVDSRLRPESRAEGLGADAAVVTVGQIAHDLGLGDRRLRRWRYEIATLERIEVEEALHRAGFALWEIYGVEEVDLEAEAYCERCHDTVTPIDGRCPWCESSTAEARCRRWCPKEDRLIFPAHDGTCWRCGTDTEPIPWAECACGCGTRVPCFDPQGRRHQFAKGHAPQRIGPHQEVPVEPFARYLEEELESMDLLGALARAHAIPRDDVVRMLKRQVGTVPTRLVRRAVWTAARGGTGKGLPMRPGAITFADLYPGFVRSKVCPGCGEGKAPHAELCKNCRRRRDREEGRNAPVAVTRVREELIEEAYRLYTHGSTIEQAAGTIRSRTTACSDQSLASSLSREWKRRGWAMRSRTTRRSEVIEMQAAA